MDELATINKPVQLKNRNLDVLPPHIRVPEYNRKQLAAGIVHIGVGNFHRAHQAWYLHQLMQMGLAKKWGILGASVRTQDLKLREKLIEQDILTTLIELSPKEYSAEVIGSILDYIPIEADNASLIKQLAQPEIRIVSLTITEGGYFFDPVSKQFNSQHPDIIHDSQNPETPKTVFGAIIAALKIRRLEGVGPITGLSCDNLVNNGTIFKNTVVSFAQMTDPNLADWIEENCTFPNSMVDCIVPVTGQRELELAEEFGIADLAPVTHENFRQWVIEDEFCNGRPELEKVGVTFTNEVHLYESMKLRILNGGHQIVATAGELLSLNTISQCMNSPIVRDFYRKVTTLDIAPLVKSVENISAVEYVKVIEQRFANPKIVDTVQRITFDSSSRHTGFLIPIIQDAVNSNTSLDGLTLTEALWARMCTGIREDNSNFELADPCLDQLRKVANEAKSEPIRWIQQHEFYGELATDSRFAERFKYWLNKINEDGVASAVDFYINN